MTIGKTHLDYCIGQERVKDMRKELRRARHALRRMRELPTEPVYAGYQWHNDEHTLSACVDSLAKELAAINDRQKLLLADIRRHTENAGDNNG
ncbi:MAG: hypothetical protein ACR2PR_11180 [Pseudohongiellaceae bacterium]